MMFDLNCFIIWLSAPDKHAYQNTFFDIISLFLSFLNMHVIWSTAEVILYSSMENKTSDKSSIVVWDLQYHKEGHSQIQSLPLNVKTDFLSKHLTQLIAKFFVLSVTVIYYNIVFWTGSSWNLPQTPY